MITEESGVGMLYTNVYVCVYSRHGDRFICTARRNSRNSWNFFSYCGFALLARYLRIDDVLQRAVAAEG